jgi:hypothetical protein
MAPEADDVEAAGEQVARDRQSKAAQADDANGLARNAMRATGRRGRH